MPDGHSGVSVLQRYTYRGDRMTDPALKAATVTLVRRPDGRCVRGRNGNILAVIDGRRIVVFARQLRKIPVNST